jgi:flagellar biosynthesis protein FlhF
VPLETYTGSDVSALLERARAALGPDAAVVAVRRTANGFELDAAVPNAGLPAGLPPAVRRRPAAPRRGDGDPRLIVLVGPTGAGKTTTLAKLANHPDAFGGRAVGLLCLDTYRVGAVEQIGIYAELSRVPLAVAYETADLERAMRRLRGCEVVLVDTAGRGPRAERDRVATHHHLVQLLPDEIHLCLPAGLAAGVARRVVAQHRGLGLTHLLPTKRDECPEDATAFDLAREFGLPVRWWTDGQEVPGDLRFATVADGAAGPVALAAAGAGV